DLDAVAAGHGDSAGDVGADEVGLDLVRGSPRATDLDIHAEPRDDVARRRGRAANQVVTGALFQEHAGEAAAQYGAGGVEADEVALDHVARSTRPFQMNGTGARAGNVVGRDDVAGCAAADPDVV